jgi:hypothetical protein
MSRRLLAVTTVFALVQIGCSRASDHLDHDARPTALSLSSQPAIGLLGIPLGTVTDVHATVVAQGGGREKAARSYRLRVTDVGSRRLSNPPTLDFEKYSFIDVNLAPDELALYRMKKGKETGTPNEAQVAELEKGYVGKQVHLIVFETGAYSGIPGGVPQDVPSWQDHGFSFSTSLVVLAERP